MNGIDKGVPEFIGHIYIETDVANHAKAFELMSKFEKIADTRARQATTLDN